MPATNLPVIVVGAGPVGLSVAAHLLERELDVVVLEAATDVGAHVREWGHVRLFSPWRFNVDHAAARLLAQTGWVPPPPDELPTGDDLYRRYLLPLSKLPPLARAIRFDHRVTDLARLGFDKVQTANRDDAPFVVRTRTHAGVERELVGRAVIDASGTWGTPNPLGANGLSAMGEHAARSRLYSGIPDVLGEHRHRYSGKKTLVVGAGHSAANSLLALVELAKTAPTTRVEWATRGESLERVLGSASDGLPARGKLGGDVSALVEQGRLVLHRRLRLVAVREASGQLEVSGVRDGAPVTVSGLDEVIVATGQRPSFALARELRLNLDPALECAAALAPLIDPNQHSCGTVRPHGAAELMHPEKNFFVIGSKSYGRAPTFLLATGYEQARSVAALLAGDVEAARRVELDLPATGVCRSDRPSAGACC